MIPEGRMFEGFHLLGHAGCLPADTKEIRDVCTQASMVEGGIQKSVGKSRFQIYQAPIYGEMLHYSHLQCDAQISATP